MFVVSIHYHMFAPILFFISALDIIENEGLPSMIFQDLNKGWMNVFALNVIKQRGKKDKKKHCVKECGISCKHDPGVCLSPPTYGWGGRGHVYKYGLQDSKRNWGEHPEPG